MQSTLGSRAAAYHYKMAWLMSRTLRVMPYLGCVVLVGMKPRAVMSRCLTIATIQAIRRRQPRQKAVSNSTSFGGMELTQCSKA